MSIMKIILISTGRIQPLQTILSFVFNLKSETTVPYLKDETMNWMVSVLKNIRITKHYVIRKGKTH